MTWHSINLPASVYVLKTILKHKKKQTKPTSFASKEADNQCGLTSALLWGNEIWESPSQEPACTETSRESSRTNPKYFVPTTPLAETTRETNLKSSVQETFQWESTEERKPRDSIPEIGPKSVRTPKVSSLENKPIAMFMISADLKSQGTTRLLDPITQHQSEAIEDN